MHITDHQRPDSRLEVELRCHHPAKPHGSRQSDRCQCDLPLPACYTSSTQGTAQEGGGDSDPAFLRCAYLSGDECEAQAWRRTGCLPAGDTCGANPLRYPCWSRCACDACKAVCIGETGETAQEVHARLTLWSHRVERPFLSRKVPQGPSRCSTRQGTEQELPLRVAEGEPIDRWTRSESCIQPLQEAVVQGILMVTSRIKTPESRASIPILGEPVRGTKPTFLSTLRGCYDLTTRCLSRHGSDRCPAGA